MTRSKPFSSPVLRVSLLFTSASLLLALAACEELIGIEDTNVASAGAPPSAHAGSANAGESSAGAAQGGDDQSAGSANGD